MIKMMITFHASFYANGGDSNTLVIKFTEHEVGWKAPVYVDEVGGRTPSSTLHASTEPTQLQTTGEESDPVTGFFQ